MIKYVKQVGRRSLQKTVEYKTCVKSLKDVIIKSTSMNEVVKLLPLLLRLFKEEFDSILLLKSKVLPRNGK